MYLPVVNCLGCNGVSGEGGAHSDGGELQLIELHPLNRAHTWVVIPVPRIKEFYIDIFSSNRSLRSHEIHRLFTYLHRI